MKQSEQLAKQGQTDQAGEKLTQVMEDISSSTVYMPVQFGHGQLQAAISALDVKSPDQATANKAVGNSFSSLDMHRRGGLVQPSFFPVISIPTPGYDD